VKKLKTNCIECGESHKISEVEALVIEHTGLAPMCPHCVITLTEDYEEQQIQHDILRAESKCNFENPRKLYYENKH
jgi:ferredoxin